MFLCDIFGSAREADKKLSIEDLQVLIPESKLLTIDTTDQLKLNENGVLVFMGARYSKLKSI